MDSKMEEMITKSLAEAWRDVKMQDPCWQRCRNVFAGTKITKTLSRRAQQRRLGYDKGRGSSRSSGEGGDPHRSALRAYPTAPCADMWLREPPPPQTQTRPFLKAETTPGPRLAIWCLQQDKTACWNQRRLAFLLLEVSCLQGRQ